jgi:hypothetical protein
LPTIWSQLASPIQTLTGMISSKVWSSPTRSCSSWLSRATCCSVCFRPVTSRAIFEAPMMRPASLRIGETLSETSMMVPSLRRRFVS